MKAPNIPSARDKLLFTPGPLTTSLSVKQAMLHDAGSWHADFNGIVAGIRENLLRLGGVSRDAGFECILMQGSGTFGVEAILSSVCSPRGKLLVISNGAYGERMLQMAVQLRLKHAAFRSAEDAVPNLDELKALLRSDHEISEVAVVHCETTTGILNPIEQIGRIVKDVGKVFIVDAMSTFGGMPIDLQASGIDYIVSSANKCIEGVPGFSFIICRRDALIRTEGFARTLSLDLIAQLKAFEKNGQFRFTPPTHSILAFEQALRELDQEGGIAGRFARYQVNHQTVMAGMAALGFKPFLDRKVQSAIITAFHTPSDSRFLFKDFYDRLSERGMIIYPGKLTQVDTFRIGNIGRLFPQDMEQLVGAVGRVLADMNIKP
jgi:2-aminoethylphosphonate-pyruvate transaminase